MHIKNEEELDDEARASKAFAMDIAKLYPEGTSSTVMIVSALFFVAGIATASGSHIPMDELSNGLSAELRRMLETCRNIRNDIEKEMKENGRT